MQEMISRWHLEALATDQMLGGEEEGTRFWACNQGDDRKPFMEKGNGIYK